MLLLCPEVKINKLAVGGQTLNVGSQDFNC
jgi:hypothetical protein